MTYHYIHKSKSETNISLNFQLSLEDCWSRHVEATNNSYLPSIYFHGTLDCTTTDNSTNSGQERCLVDFLGHVASTQSKCFVNAALQCPGSNLSRLYIYMYMSTFMDAFSGAMHANTFKEPCTGQPSIFRSIWPCICSMHQSEHHIVSMTARLESSRVYWIWSPQPTTSTVHHWCN